jgi:hypothetical protein
MSGLKQSLQLHFIGDNTMKNPTALKALVVLFTAGLWSLTASAVVFSDSFSTASTSNWVDEFGTVSGSVVNGAFKISNTGTTIGMYKHSDAHSTFTLSARVKPLSAKWDQDGLMVCWTGGTSYTGYLFVVRPGQGVVIMKMTTGSSKSLWGSWYAAVNLTDNVLAVSKQGSTLSFFCNGLFLTSVVDNSFDKGAIGLIVNGGNDVAFDDVTLTDTYKTPDTLKYFADNFTDGNLDGWSLTDTRGTLDPSKGTLAMTTDTLSSLVWVEGAFKARPVAARMRYVSGDTAGFYGILMMQIDHHYDVVGGTYYVDPSKWTGFFISSKRAYGVGAAGDSWVLTKSEHIHGGTDWDTAKIAPDLTYTMNGDTLAVDSGSYRTFAFNAVGLYADKNMAVEFDDFRAGDSSALPVHNILIRHPSAAAFALAGNLRSAVVFDPLGRLVGRYNEGVSRILPSGYFIVCSRRADRLSVLSNYVEVRK